jgi:hypothetical protein
MTWNPAKDGKPLSAELPPFWPAKDGARPEMGVCGRVVEFSNYSAKDDDGTVKIVPSVIIGDAVTYTPAGSEEREALTHVGEVTVSISAGLKHVLKERKVKIGSVITIVYKGVDRQLNGMKVFDVWEHSDHYLTNLQNAARMTSRGGRG